MLRLPTENTSDKEKKMEHWNEAKIKDFAEVKGGKRLPKGKQLIKEPNSHPYIRIRDLGKTKYLQLNSEYEYVDDETQQSIARYIVNKGDILISVVGTIGLIGIVGETLDKANQTENCDKIINIKNVLPEYLYYYLISSFGQDEIRKGTVGAVQPKLPLKNVQDITIFYPSIEEQERIVNILSSVDEKIEMNNAINKNLEEQLKSIFIDRFAASIDSLNETTCPMLGNLVVSVDNRGKTPPLANEPTAYPIIDVRALAGDSRIIDFNNCTKYVEKETYDTWFRSGHPKPGDILISTVGSLAEMKIYQGDIGCVAQNVVGFRCKSVSPLYLYQYLNYIRNDLVAYNIGSVQPSIKVTHIIKHPIYIPDQEAILAFDSIARSYTEKMYLLYQESEFLKQTRDALLPQLMSGELDVSNIDL
jgi:type I restriction enzyme S subunit